MPVYHPITPILSRTNTTLPVGELLSDINFDLYERSEAKYRKPSYQRGLKRDYAWGQKLVESVLEGKSIGSIHLSRWGHSQMVNGEREDDEYFNIEDGQTRLSSLEDFKNRKFSTKYGSYEDERIRNIFNTYQFPVIEFRKAHPRIRDSVYFAELCKNFSLLQEGSALTASDRYWSSVAAPEEGYAGSPLVNYTLEVVNGPFREQFVEYMAIPGLSARNKKT
ncbi:unnamed protein product, partial [marine sediment metagenome]